MFHVFWRYIAIAVAAFFVFAIPSSAADSEGGVKLVLKVCMQDAPTKCRYPEWNFKLSEVSLVECSTQWQQFVATQHIPDGWTVKRAYCLYMSPGQDI